MLKVELLKAELLKAELLKASPPVHCCVVCVGVRLVTDCYSITLNKYQIVHLLELFV
jgi:hypothetical protein